MSEQRFQIINEVYALIGLLPRLNHQTPGSQLPYNGVYLFFERGEVVKWHNRLTDRIVRVGTHNRDGRFSGRIRQHYGNVHSLGGNKNGSVFRKHLGGALLLKLNPQDQRLEDWLTQGGPSYAEIEEMVSRELRQNFTFSCFRADQQGERLRIEKGLIALIAQYPLGQPSTNWLGKFSASAEIRRSGLWNTQHIEAEPLTSEEFRRIEQLVTGSP